MRQIRISASITNRDSPSLGKYLQEISKLGMLSPDEEMRLAILIKEGDRESVMCLVKANLRFVVSVAKQYQGQGLSLPDLINEGNLGLIKAAGCFDHTRGFKFISYGVWWIRQHILHALAEDSRTIRLPLNQVTLRRKISFAQAQLEQQLERPGSANEVAEMLDRNISEVANCMDYRDDIVSLDSPFSADEEGSLIDVLENPNADKAEGQMYHVESLKLEIGRSMQVLTNRQKETVCYFFGIGKDHAISLEDIAVKFDVTPERVRQIKDQALTKLRAVHSSEVLRSFL
jgi:RNA polymerase primary sigma factor